MAKRSAIPEDFEVTPRIMELAKQNGWPDPRMQVDAFKDYHLAHGSLMADWEAAFRTWLRNCLRFQEKLRGTPVVTSHVTQPAKPKPAEPQMSEEEKNANRRQVGKLMSELVRKLDVRKAHEKT